MLFGPIMKLFARALALALLAAMLAGCAGTFCVSALASPRASVSGTSALPPCHSTQHSSGPLNRQSSGHDCCMQRHPAAGLVESHFPRTPLPAVATLEFERRLCSRDREAGLTPGSILSAVSPPPITRLRI
jgi:hypothetical protein